MAEIPEQRDLTPEERHLVRWLLEHGKAGTGQFVDQIPRLSVISRCSCGCASVNFGLDGRGWKSSDGEDILADYEWADADDRRFGVFVFAKGGVVAGLEVWSIDGLATPTRLPSIEFLRPIEETMSPSNTRLHPTAVPAPKDDSNRS